jgi:hypothetical protein
MSNQTAVLRSIHQTTSSLLKHLGRDVSPRANSLSTLFVDCSLPTPLPITRQLVAVGLDEHTAIHISTTFVTHASATKSTWENKLKETCRIRGGMASSQDEAAYWQQRIYAVGAKRYIEKLEQWTQDAVLRARSSVSGNHGGECAAKDKKPFNQVGIVQSSAHT